MTEARSRLKPDSAGWAAPNDSFWTPGWFALFLGLLVFAAYSDVFLGAATFRYRDFGFYSYPVAYHLRESLWNGEMPLWNQLSNCGIPFLAQWSHLALYPFAIFYILLPLSWALGVFCVLHLYLAGLGMYYLAYAWTGNRFAAALAGVVFAFNGVTINCLMWSQYMVVVGWTPWVIYTVERAWREGGRWIAIAAMTGALQMLGGTPEFILFTWLFIASLFGTRAIVHRHEWRRHLLRLCVVVMLVAGISAAQLLPFLDLMSHSQRDTGFATNDWSMPATGWANFLVPQFRCYYNKDGTVSQYGQYFTSSYYVGIGSVALALGSLWRVRAGRALFAAAVAALALVFAWGESGYLYAWLRNVAPLAGVMRYPAKFVFITVLCLPLLAAFGVREHFSKISRSPGTANFTNFASFFLVAGLILTIVGYARLFPLGDENWPMTWKSGLSRLGFLVAFGGILLGIARARTPGQFRLATALLLAATSLDVLTHYPRQSPTIARAVYEPRHRPPDMLPVPEIGERRAMISAAADKFFKYLFTANPIADYSLSRRALFSNCNLLDDIPKVDGFYPLYLRDNERLTRWLYSGTNALPEPFLDFLAVSHVTKPETFYRWTARSNALSWATTGQQPIYADAETIFRTVTSDDFDPRRMVLLPEEAQGFLTATNPSVSSLLVSRFENHTIELVVTNSAPALIVLSQTYYHAWRATVDRVPARVWRANYAFQAIEIPAGAHRVRLDYVDLAFRLGLALSAVSLAVTLWLLFRPP